MKKKLLIFIKNPRLGRVKTRLAATVGDETALDFYRRLLSYTREVAQSVEAERLLFYSDFVEENDEWSPHFFQKRVQRGSNLGERMANAFADSMPENEVENRVVIIGSDCASLTTEILNEAFLKLETEPFALGPSLDGGYYLLGMTRFEASVFQEIEWSSASVFSKTMERIAALGRSVALLAPLSDIDDESDWERFATHLH